MTDGQNNLKVPFSHQAFLGLIYPYLPFLPLFIQALNFDLPSYFYQVILDLLSF